MSYYITASIPLPENHFVTRTEEMPTIFQARHLPIFHVPDMPQNAEVLFHFLHTEAAHYYQCTFEFVHIDACPVKQKQIIFLHQLTVPQQLLLASGQMLIIEKVDAASQVLF